MEFKRKSSLMMCLERIHNDKLERILHKMYVIQNKTLKEIANELGVATTTVHKWVKDIRLSRKIKL